MQSLTSYSLEEIADSPEVINQMGNGVIPEMAEAFGSPISDVPTLDELHSLVGLVRPHNTLRDNVPSLTDILGRDALAITVDWMERSKATGAVIGAFRDTADPVPTENGHLVAAMGVANWNDRITDLLESWARVNGTDSPVITLAGNRLMDKGTELAHPNVQAFQEAEGRTPTESDYMRVFVVPRLKSVGLDVTAHAYGTKVDKEIVRAAFGEHPELFDRNVIVFRTAGAGVAQAARLRREALNVQREVGREPDFDMRMSPQLYVVTDSFPIARTEQEVAQADRFQSPLSGASNIPFTARMLLEASQQL